MKRCWKLFFNIDTCRRSGLFLVTNSLNSAKHIQSNLGEKRDMIEFPHFFKNNKRIGLPTMS